jgi:hypothetical protein
VSGNLASPIQNVRDLDCCPCAKGASVPEPSLAMADNRASKHGHKLATFQLIELHLNSSARRGWNAAYRIGKDQSVSLGRMIFGPEVCSGTFSTELVWTKRSLRSAMPPIATEFTRYDESTRCAQTTSYSITSSARPSSSSGTVMPSFLAVA